MKDRKSKRLLVTLPESVVDDLELAHETTNWSKSQVITLCVRRALKDVLEGYNPPLTQIMII